MEAGICVSRAKEENYASECADYLRRELFCDARLVCGEDPADGGANDGGDDGRVVRCHRLVLAALSSNLADALALAGEEGGGEVGDVTLVLPDARAADIRAFLEAAYSALAGHAPPTPEGGDGLQEVARLLCVDLGQRVERGQKQRRNKAKKEEATEAGEEEEEEVDDEPRAVKLEPLYDEGLIDDDEAGERWDPDSDSDYKPFDPSEFEEDRPRRRKRAAAVTAGGTGRKRGRPRKVKVEEEEEEDEEEFYDDELVAPAVKRTRRGPGRPPGRPRRAEADEKPRVRLGFAEKVSGLDGAAVALLEREVADLEAKVTAAAGQLTAQVRPPPRADASSSCLLDLKTCVFAALVGLGAAPSGETLARPVAHSPGGALSADERSDQYAALCEALKSAFGLSDVEAQHHVAVRRQVNLKNLAKFSYRRDFKTYSTEMLEAVFDREDVRRAHQKGAAKFPFRLPPDGPATLTLTGELRTEDVRGLALLTLDVARGLSVATVEIGEGDDARKSMAAALMDALFETWRLRNSEEHPEITKHDRMHKAYLAVHPAAEMALVAREYLDNPHKMKSDGSAPPEKQCPDCGVVFPLLTAVERGRYEAHKNNHFFEKFECDCEVTWKTKSGKKFHVMHAHMEGFVKCPHCVYVCRPSGLATHVRSQHEEMTCEHCAATVKGKYRLGQHMVSFHPEHAENKRIAGSGTCEICGDFYVGLSKHIRSAHKPREHCSCDICGKQFLRKTNLKSHRLRIHFPEEMAFSCEICNGRFEDREHLRKHMHNAHIKSRHLVCRYEGCTMAYDDSGSRSNHERIKHGHPYPRAAKLGLVPPLVRKKSPFLLPIPMVTNTNVAQPQPPPPGPPTNG